MDCCTVPSLLGEYRKKKILFHNFYLLRSGRLLTKYSSCLASLPQRDNGPVYPSLLVAPWLWWVLLVLVFLSMLKLSFSENLKWKFQRFHEVGCSMLSSTANSLPQIVNSLQRPYTWIENVFLRSFTQTAFLIGWTTKLYKSFISLL